MSVIVVSDVHLGSATSNNIEFLKFLDWLATLEKEGGKTIKPGVEEILLKPPEKFILLGDILDLWAPQHDDPKYTIQKGFEPFGKLVGLGCEKIFVLGNHDEGIADYLDEKDIIKENIFKINNADFRIINRHYPENPEDKNKGFLQVGKHKYFFIHGQQFDKTFNRFGPLARMPTYIEKVSNFLRIFGFNGWSVVPVFILLLALYWRISGGYRPYLFDFVVILGVLSFIRVLTSIWSLLPISTDPAKYKDIKTIVERKYYDVNADKTDWDVNIVFGHTHVPEIDSYKFTENGKEHECLFLNSGSWTKEKGDHNTLIDNNNFIYLDESGYYLFKWNPGGDIELISRGN